VNDDIGLSDRPPHAAAREADPVIFKKLLFNHLGLLAIKSFICERGLVYKRMPARNDPMQGDARHDGDDSTRHDLEPSARL